MPNRAYASIWLQDFTEASMLGYFERFIATIPVSEGLSGYTELVVRAIDTAETPLQEYDLRGQTMTPADITQLAREYNAADVSYELAALWDLWLRDVETVSWNKKPERLDIFCLGPEYDNGISAESGHFLVGLGLEHRFTGHAQLLSRDSAHVAEPEHPDEARFLMWMSQPKNLREYQEKTRENIQKLMDWVKRVEESLPVERLRLWSEGEENFEARLDEILAVR